jgi:hypothetical protein
MLFCFDVTGDNLKSKSFKLAIDASDTDLINNPNSWPDRIIIKPWVYKEMSDTGTVAAGIEQLASGDIEASGDQAVGHDIINQGLVVNRRSDTVGSPAVSISESVKAGTTDTALQSSATFQASVDQGSKEISPATETTNNSLTNNSMNTKDIAADMNPSAATVANVGSAADINTGNNNKDSSNNGE